MRYRDMIGNCPTHYPLWLAKRKWRLDGRRRDNGGRAFVLGFWLYDLGRRHRWQRWTGPYATLDGRRRQPAFYGIERQMSISPDGPKFMLEHARIVLYSVHHQTRPQSWPPPKETNDDEPNRWDGKVQAGPHGPRRYRDLL